MSSNTSSNSEIFYSMKSNLPHSPERMLNILAFGDPTRSEFRFLWENLREINREKLFFEGNLDLWLQTSERTRHFNADFYPDLIFILRSWSGEYSNSQIQTLRKRFPLTPLLAVLGSWCEGEARNGIPLSGIHSISWFELCAMFPLESFALKQNWASIWSLPPETLPEQKILFEIQREEKQKNFRFTQKRGSADDFENLTLLPSLNIQIESDDFDQFILLRDFSLRTFSSAKTVRVFSSWQNDLWLSTEEDKNNRKKLENTDFIFFDFPDFSQMTIQKFHAIKNRFPTSIFIAFTEFPRAEEWLFLKKNGVHAMFPKPFRIADLAFYCCQKTANA